MDLNFYKADKKAFILKYQFKHFEHTQENFPEMSYNYQKYFYFNNNDNICMDQDGF